MTAIKDPNFDATREHVLQGCPPEVRARIERDLPPTQGSGASPGQTEAPSNTDVKSAQNATQRPNFKAQVPFAPVPPPKAPAVTSARETGDGAAPPVVVAVGRMLSECKMRNVRWLWYGRIPLGTHTDICGSPGQGKSTVLLDLAARVTTGSPMPDDSPSFGAKPGEKCGTPRGVVFLTAEDSAESTVRPRFEAAGGDADLLYLLEGVTITTKEGKQERMPDIGC